MTPDRCATDISWLVVHEARPVKLSGRTLRLSILIGEGDTWHHRSRYARIERRADKTGPAEAALIREIEGFGRSFHPYALHPFRSSSDLPLLIVIIDAEHRVRAFLPRLDELRISGLLMLEKVDIISYGTEPWTGAIPMPSSNPPENSTSGVAAILTSHPISFLGHTRRPNSPMQIT